MKYRSWDVAPEVIPGQADTETWTRIPAQQPASPRTPEGSAMKHRRTSPTDQTLSFAVPPGASQPPPSSPGGWEPQGQPPGRPPRRHRVWRWVTGIAAALVILIVGGVILAVATAPAPQGTHSIGQAAPSPSGPAGSPAAAAAPAAPMHATRIKFVINGQIPASEFGTVDISYGSNNHTHDVSLTSLAGKQVFTVRYNPDSEWYSADVSWSGPGKASVRMVVLSDSGEPLPVAHGDASATGTNGYGDASVQASPNNRAGTSWQDESSY